MRRPLRFGDRRVMFAGVCAAWLLFIVAGLVGLTRYASTPGALAAAPELWPRASEVPRTAGVPTLVMLAHPHCACTRASIHELARLMDQVSQKLAAHVLLVSPKGVGQDWDKTDLWQSAAQIPGVDVLRDPGGVEAARFGAETSGQVVLYDGAGQLLFRGGITSGRGHEGDNVGRQRIVALLAERPAPHDSPVFGCSLTDEGGEP